MSMIYTDIDGVVVLKPQIYKDNRGYFYESYNQRTLAENGINFTPVQENHIMSLNKGTLRGIHFQNNPHAQAKLVRCTTGSVLDIAVDLRRGSPTYLNYVSVELSSENKLQMYIPKGFGHAVLSLSPNTECQYYVDDFYSPHCERTIFYNDPQVNVDWGGITPFVSDKDAKAPFLEACDFDVSGWL